MALKRSEPCLLSESCTLAVFIIMARSSVRNWDACREELHMYSFYYYTNRRFVVGNRLEVINKTKKIKMKNRLEIEDIERTSEA